MSLRDWFAGQALNGLLADDDLSEENTLWQEYASMSYEMADAMMEARKEAKQ